MSVEDITKLSRRRFLQGIGVIGTNAAMPAHIFKVASTMVPTTEAALAGWSISPTLMPYLKSLFFQDLGTIFDSENFIARDRASILLRFLKTPNIPQFLAADDQIRSFVSEYITLDNLNDFYTITEQHLQDYVRLHLIEGSTIVPDHIKRNHFLNAPHNLLFGELRNSHLNIIDHIGFFKKRDWDIDEPSCQNLLRFGADSRDIEFLIEQNFLHSYGYRANYFTLHPDYESYLKTISKHPLMGYKRFFDLSEGVIDSDLQRIFGCSDDQIIDFTEADINRYRDFTKFVQDNFFDADLEISPQILKNTAHMDITEFQNYLKPMIQRAHQKKMQNFDIELQVIAADFPCADGHMALYKINNPYANITADDLEISICHQFTSAVKVIKIHQSDDACLAISWDATKNDLDQIDAAVEKFNTPDHVPERKRVLPIYGI